MRWFVCLCFAFLLESVLISLMFFYQSVEYINTPQQNAWLASYGTRSLYEFIWTKFILFEFIRRLPWVFYGLVLVSFAGNFPLFTSHFPTKLYTRNLFLHAGFALLLGIVHGICTQLTLGFLFPMEEFPVQIFLRTFSGLFLSILHYCLIVSIFSMLQYFQKFQTQELRAAQLESTTARLETELAQAQLQALKMQLQPHFLFNSLNSISALLYSNPRRADTMIARLGDFLRMTLENPNTQFITLQQELDLLRCFVDIEMMRFPQRLHVEFSIEAGLQGIFVPNLLLQPLVENSIKYGILQSTSGGRIDIGIRRLPSRQNHCIEITVRDNGPGIQPTEKATTQYPAQYSSQYPAQYSSQYSSIENEQGSGMSGILLRKKSSIGLANTKARLEKLYGTDFRFDTYNAHEGGFVVYMEIPLQRNISTFDEKQHLFARESA